MQRRLIMVIGMHRSGTSLVAQALDRLGVVFGGDLLPANKWNEWGYYEYRPAVQASLKILRKLDRRPFTPRGQRPLPAGWVEQSWVRAVEDRLAKQLESDFQKLELSTAHPFGLKDPHATLLLPFWERVIKRIDAQAEYVLALRHPVAVTRSVWRRDHQEPADTERMWLLYNVNALCYGCERIQRIVDYAKLRDEPDASMEALASALKLSPVGAFPKSPYAGELDHAEGSETILLEPVRALYIRLASVQPGLDDWKELCRETKSLVKTVEVFEGRVYGPSALEPLIGEGQVIEDRGMLTKRRRRILYPDSNLELPRLWPPPGTVNAVRDHVENSAVAVVANFRPQPAGYGPVGRYTGELISAMVRNGVQPTLLDLGNKEHSDETQVAVKAFWPEGSVIYQYVEEPNVPCVRGLLASVAKEAYRLYEWLKHRNFDVVHAPDFRGSLYFCQRAKEQGIAFASTRFVVHPVQGLFRRKMQEYQSLDAVELLPRIYLEHSSLELADIVPVPGMYALRMLLDAGMEFAPEQIEHWPLPFDHAAAANAFAGLTQDKNSASIRRILCLPGNSHRGIALFLKALKRSFPHSSIPFSVEFGVPESSRRRFKSFVKIQASGLGKRPLVSALQDRTSLVELLRKEPKTLCVLPVVNSWNRYQLRDLAAAGAEIVVADRNAASEILAGTDWANISCAPLPDAIGKQMRVRAQSRGSAPELQAQVQVPVTWVTPAMPHARPNPLPTEAPLVTVCLMHFERPHLVEQALASVEEQTYGPLEVVLVDDGSLKKETIRKLEALKIRFQKTGWRVIRQQNRYLGAARNTAAMAAQGRYLYFLDDDNVLKVHALETLVKVAEHMGADVVTALSDTFEGNHPPISSAFASRRIIQVGDDLSYGLYRNGFGDSNALIRRSTFLALGGNTEDYAVGKDDMEFYARAVLNGCRLTLVPEALFWARQTPTRLRNLHFSPDAGNVRVLRTYMPYIPSKMRPVLLLAANLVESALDGKRGEKIIFRTHLVSKAKRMANTHFGSSLRYALLGPLRRRLRERLSAGRE